MRSIFNQLIDLPGGHLQVLKSCSFPAPSFMGAISSGGWEAEERPKQIQVSGEPTTFCYSYLVSELAEKQACHCLPADSSCDSKVLAWIILLSIYFDVKRLFNCSPSELSAYKAVSNHRSLLMLCVQQLVTRDTSVL